MRRRDLWWLGLAVAVAAGLAVGILVRQTSGPFTATASPDAVSRDPAAAAVGPAPRPAAVYRAASSPVGLAPPPAQGTSSGIPFTERAECVNGSAVGSGNEGLLDDCAVLLAARDALRGTATTLNWDAGTAIGSWYGITVGGTPGRVTRLHLDGRNSRTSFGELIVLGGTIPPVLGQLTGLEHLLLSRHGLTGTIPPALGNLTELTNLSLHGDDLTGPIPPELGYLSNLVSLYLSGSGLSGGTPVELSKLSNLLILDLQGNDLTGSIPAALGDLPSLVIFNLHNNTMLAGCIPESLRGVSHDFSSLGLSYCTTTTYALTTEVTGNGRISPLPGTYSYLDGESVTVTATPDAGYRVASWGDDCSGTASTCALTMDAAKTASVTFERITHELEATVTGEGTVTPGGTTTHEDGVEVTLRASWSDATHDFTGWGGDCSGTASACVLTMDAAKSVTAAFAALPAARCAQPTDADCIRAVYRGAPGDYAQVADIPPDVLLEPDADGRYRVARGEQVTVVTAAPLPAGWTRFYLERSPMEFGTPSPVSSSQLIAPVGTTYTFTPAENEAASTLITFDLVAARPFVRPRPDSKPELGDVVVTTVFQVETDVFTYDTFDTTGAATAAGSYAFLMPDGTSTSAVTTYEQLRDGTTTALIVNTTDAHGAHQADRFDAVGVGDLFEWHESDDCFVRYRVTEVAADPPGTAPRKQFGVEWMTYAFTGCSGAITSASGSAGASGTVTTTSITWGSLPDLGGTSLIAPVVHGIYQIVPEDWEGDTKEGEYVYPPRYSEPAYTEDINVARTYEFWREPAVPDNWEFTGAWRDGGDSRDGVTYGYCAEWGGRERTLPGSTRLVRPVGIVLCAHFAVVRFVDRTAGYTYEDEGSSYEAANETRVIAGRPARFFHSPPGPHFDDYFPIRIEVFDPETEVTYEIEVRDDKLSEQPGAVVEMARSLFEDD